MLAKQCYHLDPMDESEQQMVRYDEAVGSVALHGTIVRSRN